MKKITLTLMDFAERLKAHRSDKGLSLEAVAKMAGVSKQSVHNWEHGSPPRLDRAHKVVLGLGLTMRSFFGPTEAEAAEAWEAMRHADG